MRNRMLIEAIETEAYDIDTRELNVVYKNTTQNEENNPIETSLNKWYADTNFFGERYDRSKFETKASTRRSY